MTNFYSKNISADSFSGAIFALEGIHDSCVILNGPTGCKFYHTSISDKQYMKRSLFVEPYPIEQEFYFGHPRIPSTYLDGYDYVYGSSNKLSAILKDVLSKGYKLIAIVNSPGAALIGDDLEKFLQKEVKDTPCFALENTGFSGTFSDGYQKALLKTLSSLPLKPRRIRPKTVNLLGFCIYQKYYEGNIDELKRLLSLCDIEVISTLGALDKIETITHCTEAEYNVVIYPELGDNIAKKLAETHQIPYISLEAGPPFGFKATESFIKQICKALDANPEKALLSLEKARARAYLYMSRFSNLLGLPKGSLFSLKGESSVAYALSKFLCTYLGMIPAAINITEKNEIYQQKLEQFLESINHKQVLENCVSKTPTHIVFGDGNTIAQLRLEGLFVCGIEISLPSLNYLDIMEKSILGEKGSLFLLEQLMNGLRYL